MKATTVLTRGENALTLLDLLRKVAVYKGLELHEGASRASSKLIKEYTLDERLLKLLAERGIRQQNHFGIICDVIGFDLYVGFGLSKERRGVVLVPIVVGITGPFVPKRGRFPEFEVFKALVEDDPNTPAVAKELAASDGAIVVTWTELGLGGIKQIAGLFAEFAGHNEAVAQLGRNGEIFDPDPHPRYQQPGNELFILEPTQPIIIEAWRKQLKEYRSSLVV